ncbi:pentatricopeptide repeat-containing protein, partial [Trifolium medium]|nr:pentatricopeptide repeat-containing protein [Trifolium medium]
DVSYNTLVNGWSKKGDFERVKELIKEMLKLGLRVSAAYTYNPLVDGYCKKGMVGKANDLVEMLDRGALPTVSTYNAIMYGRCREGEVSGARGFLDVMVSKNLKPDLVSYNTLIDGYSR